MDLPLTPQPHVGGVVEAAGGVDAEFGPAEAKAGASAGVQAEQTAGGVAAAGGLFGKNFVAEKKIRVHARGAQDAAHVGFKHGGFHLRYTIYD